MRDFKRDRGFLVFAQNSKVDYVRLAYALALSLKVTQKEHGYLSIIVTPGTDIPKKYIDVFDEIIDVPWLDAAKHSEWKLENEWKAYHATPYRETIKLDADMLFPTDISKWWDILSEKDLWICNNVETYRGDLITSDVCRKTFTSNALPNLYTAFTYFKMSEKSQEYFDLCGLIFDNWEFFSYEFLDETRPRQVSTDLVFSLAAHMMNIGSDITHSDFPRFVHMKSELQGWNNYVEDWSTHVPMIISKNGEIKIGRYVQTMPFHYHVKSILTDKIIEKYESLL